jgi:hypothetical protein
MTRAPSNLMAVRTLLLDHLGRGGLTSAAVGIVGDPNHRGGYHCGSDRVDLDDYSVRESRRDRNGLTQDACALDVGWFRLVVDGTTHNLRTFSAWCAAQCRAGAPDTRDIREIIYSSDGLEVKRYDALGIRSSGDSSHLSHTHFSYFRDAIKAGRDQRPLFWRYLQTIGLLEDEMAGETADHLLTKLRGKVIDGNRDALAEMYLRVSRGDGLVNGEPYHDPNNIQAVLAKLDQIEGKLAHLASADLVDEVAIGAQVLAGLTPAVLSDAIRQSGLTPQALAAAIPDEIADDLLSKLGERLNSGPQV